MINNRMDWLRFSGLAAVGVIWTGIGVGMRRAGLGIVDNRPISYLGSQVDSALLFSLGLILSALLFGGFYVYVKRSFPASKSFSAAMLIGLAGQVATAIIPYYGSSLAHRTHTITALALAFSLPLLMWRFAASQPAGRLRQASYRLLWLQLVLFSIGAYLFSLYGMAAPLAQILPAIAYHVWIITLTLKTPKHQTSGVPAG